MVCSKKCRGGCKPGHAVGRTGAAKVIDGKRSTSVVNITPKCWHPWSKLRCYTVWLCTWLIPIGLCFCVFQNQPRKPQTNKGKVRFSVLVRTHVTYFSFSKKSTFHQISLDHRYKTSPQTTRRKNARTIHIYPTSTSLLCNYVLHKTVNVKYCFLMFLWLRMKLEAIHTSIKT